MSLPLTGAYLAETTITLGSIMIIGRLGTVELAAVGLASGLLFILLYVGMDVLAIVGVLVAEAYGAGDHEVASQRLQQGLWLASAVSILGMILCCFVPPLLRLARQDDHVVQQAARYLGAAVWCFPATMWSVTLRNFTTALSRTRASMVITIASVLVNLGLCYGLGLGRLGFGFLGVAGAGYATSIASWVMLAGFVGYICATADLRALRVFDGLWLIRSKLSWEMLRLGLPVGGLTIIENGMFSTVGMLMGVLGASTLAANQIVISFLDFAIIIAFAIGEATAIRVASAVGQADAGATRSAAWTGVSLGAAVMILVAGVLWFLPQTIISLFIDIHDPANSGVAELTVTLFRIAAFFQLFDGVQVITTRALRGLKDTTAPILIAAIGFWLVGVMGGCALCFWLRLGGPGLWWGLALGLASAAGLLFFRLDSQLRSLSFPRTVAPRTISRQND